MKERIAYIIAIAALFAFIIFQRECSPRVRGYDCPEIELVNTEIRRGDFRFYKVPGETPLPQIIIDSFEVIVPADVDTTAILKDYFSTVFSRDSFTDREVTVIIEDSISQNRIFHRSRFIQNNRASTISTYTITDPVKTKVFIGPTIGGGKNSFDVGASIMLMTKKEHAYAYTYQAVSRQHNLTAYFKISFRRKSKGVIP